jgi:hypothetical protein
MRKQAINGFYINKYGFIKLKELHNIPGETWVKRGCAWERESCQPLKARLPTVEGKVANR